MSQSNKHHHRRPDDRHCPTAVVGVEEEEATLSRVAWWVLVQQSVVMSGGTAIVWFRKCLRVHDNVALVEAAKKASEVIPVFVLDPAYCTPERVGAARLRFLCEALEDLDLQLREKLESRLLVVRGEATSVLSDAFAGRGELGSVTRISACFWEADLVESYALKRDAAVMEAAGAHGVEARGLNGGHSLWDLEEALRKNGGKAPTSMPQMVKLAETKLGTPVPPLAIPSKLPPMPESVRRIANKFAPPKPSEIGLVLRELGSTTKDDGDMEEDYAPADGIRGGEGPGLERLKAVLERDGGNFAAAFEKPKTTSTKTEPVATTLLSPYLKFGCVSARRFHADLLDVYRSRKHSLPPASLLGQLYFREMAYMQALAVGPDRFGVQENSPVCAPIPWQDDATFLKAWECGRTGYPLIDAYMRQLRKTGFVHHLGRHAVACFLTRGDLWVSWEKGAEVFEKYLLDADPSVNVFNWLGLSGAAPWSPPYFRVYSPTPDPKKKSALNVDDPNGDFIRKYVPELRDFPAKFIYQPWTAPIADQRRANCVVGRDYPKPIVDHKTASQANIAKFKAALDAHRLAKGGGAASSSSPSKSKRKTPRGPADSAPPAAKKNKQTPLQR